VSTAAATLSTTLLAAAEAERSAVVVSLHDVAPPTREKTARIIDQLTQLGVRCCSLLVVPNYHQSGSSFADAEFVRWLRQLEAAGHEVVMHGYYHARPVADHEDFRDRLITRVYTNREGEFYDLPYDEAFRRISQARDEFRNAGLKPHGFIAPAWLLSALVGLQRADTTASQCQSRLERGAFSPLQVLAAAPDQRASTGFGLPARVEANHAFRSSCSSGTNGHDLWRLGSSDANQRERLANDALRFARAFALQRDVRGVAFPPFRFPR
jgi:hypothetical protein